MSSAPLCRAWPLWVVALLILPATAAPSGASPSPTAVTPPFALPLLEGAQVKVDIGNGAPSGPATSYVGNNPASINFSVWWWDTGEPTSALLVFDGTPRPMVPGPSNDPDDFNGTLYEARVDATTLAPGDHEWFFSFQGPSGAVRLPAVGNFTQLRLDVADRFISTPLRNAATTLNQTYRGGTIDLRDVASRATNTSNSWMGTDWNVSSGYTNYSDPNHFILNPAGLVSDNREVFVLASGAQRARYPDSGALANNSQPAIKQALVLKALLLATGLFNASDIELRAEPLVVNGYAYNHPFVRLKLNDGSDRASDGPVAADGLIDLDVWAMGLGPAVPIGKHFGDDDDISNDAAWDSSIGWPTAADPNAAYVVSLYSAAIGVVTPDGASESLYLLSSQTDAAATNPLVYGTYWNDALMVFDGLSSTQSASMDLAYTWQIETTILTATGPVWFVPLTTVGNYSVTLTVRDPFLFEDSITIAFYIRSKTRVSAQIPDMTFTEDRSDSRNLKSYFADDDGFGTITFSLATQTTPPGGFTAQLSPPGSSVLLVAGASNWCGSGTVDVLASDAISPAVSQSFNVTIVCDNDAPVVSGLPTNYVFDEDTSYTLNAVSSYATDADCCDTLTWWFSGAMYVTAPYDAGSDSLTFRAPANWSGVDSGRITVSDGFWFVNTTVAISVNRANDPPYLHTPLPVFSILEDAPNQTMILIDYFGDPDGDPLAATVTPRFGLDAGYNTVLRQAWFHPMANFSGPTGFEIRVRDPSGAAIVSNVTVNVAAVNDPPIITSVSPSGFATAGEGERFSFSIQASDSDSPSLVYSFQLDGLAEGAAYVGTYEWQPGFTSAGHHDLNVTVSDGAGGSVSYHWSILVSDRNRSPVVSIAVSGNGTYGTSEPIRLTVEGADPDGDEMTYTWTFEGLLQPREGPDITISFTSGGNYTIKLTANDGKASTTVSTSVQVIYVEPPGPGPGTNPPPPPPTTSGGFLPGLGAALAVGGLVAAAAAVAWRRRR